MKMRLKYIDGIRGLLCLWVVLFHYTYRYKLLYPLDVIDIPYGGPIGVTLFFFISALFTCKSSTNIMNMGGARWLGCKLIRLYPVYICSIVIIYFALMVFHLPGRDNVSFFDFLMNIILVPLLKGQIMIDAAHWYLFALIKFYICVLILFKLRLLNNFLFYCILLPIIVFFEIMSSERVFYHFLFNGHILSLLTGICFYNMLNTVNTTKWKILNLIYILSIMYIEGFVLGIAIIIFELILQIPQLQPFFNFQIFTYFGRVSYAWYLLHQNIGFIIIYHFHTKYGDYFSILMALFITYFLALLTTYLVEKPILNRLGK